MPLIHIPTAVVISCKYTVFLYACANKVVFNYVNVIQRLLSKAL